MSKSPAPRARSACSARCGQRWVWVQCRCMPGIGVWHVKVTSPTCEERLQRKMWAEVGVGAVQVHARHRCVACQSHQPHAQGALAAQDVGRGGCGVACSAGACQAQRRILHLGNDGGRRGYASSIRTCQAWACARTRLDGAPDRYALGRFYCCQSGLGGHGMRIVWRSLKAELHSCPDESLHWHSSYACFVEPVAQRRKAEVAMRLQADEAQMQKERMERMEVGLGRCNVNDMPCYVIGCDLQCRQICSEEEHFQGVKRPYFAQRAAWRSTGLVMTACRSPFMLPRH
eukprot:1150644-Pelagomonas_calceolata.AAC.2